MNGDTFDKFAPPERGRFGDNEAASEPLVRGPRVTGASDLRDLNLTLHNDNPAKKAIAVSESECTPFEDWKWLLRSLIEYEEIGIGVNGNRLVRVTLPERLAREKGLI
jgi:hypothetical protein